MEYVPTQNDYSRISYQAVRCAMAVIMSTSAALTTANGDPLIDDQRLYRFLIMAKKSLDTELNKRIQECNVKGEYVEND